jgi:glutamate-5-semialdehyde dehydrogenase
MSEINLREMALAARAAGRRLGLLDTATRNGVLLEMARQLESAPRSLQDANEADLAEARQAALAPSLLDRLALTPKRIQGMAQGCRDVAALPDPLNEQIEGRALPNGLHLAKRRVPLGTLAVIFESRPNVTVDISALALKTGNAAILRGGKETLRSNAALVELVHAACAAAGAPPEAVQFISSPDRALVPELLGMDDLIDLVIPRGGPGLQALVRQHARMPVIYGGIGVCHIFVDETADLERALPLINNSKTQAPSVCNALDTVLVHRAVAERFLPVLAANLNASGVKVLGDAPSLRALAGASGLNPALIGAAQAEDYGKEFLSLALSVKVVDSLDEAMAHIARYSTQHTDVILTNDYAHAQRFMAAVDAAMVGVNVSTRFNDGGEFGLGAEVAISTQRMHARGPMGLRELTTYKWTVQGDYHVRK